MLLQDYLTKKKLTKYKAAKELGVTWNTVWRWTTGRTTPLPDQIERVQQWSGGKVTANDWMAQRAEAAKTPA